MSANMMYQVKYMWPDMKCCILKAVSFISTRVGYCLKTCYFSTMHIPKMVNVKFDQCSKPGCIVTC